MDILTSCDSNCIVYLYRGLFQGPFGQKVIKMLCKMLKNHYNTFI